MSLFLGKDTANSNVLHITKGVTPKESMRSGVLANTIFHSDLPYVTLLDYAEASVFNATYDERYSSGGAKVYTRTGYIEIPSTFYNYFNDNYLIVIEVKSTNSSGQYFFPMFHSSAAFNARAAGTKFHLSGGYKSFRSNTAALSTHLEEETQSYVCSASYPYLTLFRGLYNNSLLHSYGSYGSLDALQGPAKLYAYNIKNGSYIPNVTTTNGIFINKYRFEISNNGVILDLAKNSFIKLGTVSDEKSIKAKFLDNGNSLQDLIQLHKYNYPYEPVTEWEIDADPTRCYIRKYTGASSSMLIDTLSMDTFCILQSSAAYKYTTNISNSSVLLGTHTLASNTRLVAIHGAGTFTGNGVQLQYNPISFFIGTLNNITNMRLGVAKVGVTNYQGGVSYIYCGVVLNYTASTKIISITASVSQSGNPYPMSGTCVYNINFTLFS